MDIKSSSGGKMPARKMTPHKFRCKVGGEWKGLDQFSGSQQKLIQRQFLSGKAINAALSGMTCKDHSSNNRSELTCEVCHITKDLDEFSKSSRRNGVYQCKRCVAWAETQEPDVTPVPLETGHVSVEESAMWETKFTVSTDFFSGDTLPQAPVTDAASLGLEDLAARSDVDIDELLTGSAMPSEASVSGSSVSAATSTQRSLPPHLQAKMGNLKLNDAQSSKATLSTTSKSIASRNLPPHLRAKLASTAFSSVASVTSDDYSGSVSTATTVREEKEKEKENENYGQVEFNAWDSSGQQHRGAKAPTIITASSSSVASELGDSGWEASSSVNQPVMRTTGKGKWPKASECRIPQAELKRQIATEAIFARCVEPKADKSKMQTFCEPDDDDDIYDP